MTVRIITPTAKAEGRAIADVVGEIGRLFGSAQKSSGKDGVALRSKLRRLHALRAKQGAAK